MSTKLKDLLNENFGLGEMPSDKLFKYNKETGKFESPEKRSQVKEESLTESKSLIPSNKILEQDVLEATLKDIYSIVSGNRRDYLNIPDSLVKELSKFK